MGTGLPLPKEASPHICCDQMAGWIKMTLGRELGLCRSDIVLDGNPVPPPQIGDRPQTFGPYLLWPKGSMDQDATWYGGRPRPRPHCARWGPSFPSPKGGTAPSPIFGPCLLLPNGWTDQYATWYEGRPWPRPHCYMVIQESPMQRGTHPYCRPMSIVAKRSPISATAEHLLEVKTVTDLSIASIHIIQSYAVYSGKLVIFQVQ